MRFAVAWGLQALSLVVVHWLVPGVRLEAAGPAELAAEAMAVALVLAALNSSVRPALLWLTLPVNVFTLGLFSLAINALMLYMVSWVLPFLVIAHFGSALLGSVVLAAVATSLGTVTAIDSHYSFFGGVVEWLARRLGSTPSGDNTRGIIILEIDGLSRERLETALERGRMPFLRDLLSRGHCLTGYDSGLPSQTSSSQAGIMFGNNWDIPGFRWYDKNEGRVVSSRNPADARAIEAHVSHSHGLLREGSSINNLLSGGRHEDGAHRQPGLTPGLRNSSGAWRISTSISSILTCFPEPAVGRYRDGARVGPGTAKATTPRVAAGGEDH